MVGKLSKDMVKVETSSSLIPVEREPRSTNHITHWFTLGPGAIPQVKKYAFQVKEAHFGAVQYSGEGWHWQPILIAAAVTPWWYSG